MTDDHMPIDLQGQGSLRLQTEQEVDGRWIVEAPDLPGALAYGATVEEAAARVLDILRDHSRCIAAADRPGM